MPDIVSLDAALTLMRTALRGDGLVWTQEQAEAAIALIERAAKPCLAAQAVQDRPAGMTRRGYVLSEPTLLVGDQLWSSCAAEVYGVVVGIGKDDNDVPTIDLHVLNPNKLIIQPGGLDSTDEDYDPQFPKFCGLTTLDIGDAKAILRKLQYRVQEGVALNPRDPEDVGLTVTCKTPGDGCYRCTKHFYVKRPVAKEQAPGADAMTADNVKETLIAKLRLRIDEWQRCPAPREMPLTQRMIDELRECCAELAKREGKR